MELNEKLVALRKKKGLSQAELAEAIKVSRQAISRWEVGTAIPSADNLMWLSKFYDVSMDELMGTVINAGNSDAQSVEPKTEFLKKIVIALCIVVMFIGVIAWSKLFAYKENTDVPINIGELDTYKLENLNQEDGELGEG